MYYDTLSFWERNLKVRALNIWQSIKGVFQEKIEEKKDILKEEAEKEKEAVQEKIKEKAEEAGQNLWQRIINSFIKE